MKLKRVFVVCDRDKLELPVAVFDSIKSASLFLNKPVKYLFKCLYEDFGILVSSKLYSLHSVLFDEDAEDDEIEDAEFTVIADYKHGKFYQDYRTFEEAKECAFALTKKHCNCVEIYRKDTLQPLFAFHKV